MSALDEAKRLRIREARLADTATWIEPLPTGGAACLVAITRSLGSYPSVAASYFACSAQTILGDEVEGGSGVVTTEAATFFALNLGTAVPPSGTPILVIHVGNRWVFRYDG